MVLRHEDQLGLDAHSRLGFSVVGTAACVNDVTGASALLHGQEEGAFCDAACQSAHKRLVANRPASHVAMRPGPRRRLDPFIEQEFLAEQIERLKSSVKAKVEHPLRVLKRQFGFTKVCHRGLSKNAAQAIALVALGNLWQAR